MDFCDTGATAKFQSQRFEVARYCVRKKLEAQDVGAAGWDLAPVQLRMRDDVSVDELRMGQEGGGSALGETEEDAAAVCRGVDEDKDS